MDVGINYRDLVVTGRLQALARKLGVSEQEALGRFVISCFETQDRELIEVTRESYADAVGLRIDDPEAMLKALEASQLASRTESGWLLRGNEKHVQRLQAYRTNAKNGGIARSKQAAAKRDPSGSTLKPKRLASGSQAESKSNPSGTQGRASDLATEAEKTEIVTGPKRQPSGTQAASNGLDVETQAGPKRLDVGTQARAVFEPPSSKFRALDTGINTRDPDQDPDLTSPVLTPISESRSSVSSDAERAIALTAPPSAAAVAALRALDPPPPKRKERSPEQKQRSVANARLYRELYAAAEGHEPTGLDQAFYGAMAKFSDKHADGAEQILRWVFERCPDKSFRAKGWPLPLIIEQAPRLWRELNNPRAAVESLAAPRQQHQLALAASNDLAFEEYQRRKAERLANAKQV